MHSDEVRLSNYCIIGGDSLIAKEFSAKLEGIGQSVHSTTRKAPNRPNQTFLNLSEDVENWKIPEGSTHAVIFAGIGNVQQCEIQYELARKINVTNTLKLITRFSEKDIFVLFLSSNLRFTDSKYGQMKAEVETAMEKQFPKAAVLRLSKVTESLSTLVKTWHEQLSKGKNIKAFDNLNVTPVACKLVADVIFKICENKKSGVFQLSGSMPLSYFELALLLAKKWNFPSHLIVKTVGHVSNGPILETSTPFDKNIPTTLEEIDRLVALLK